MRASNLVIFILVLTVAVGASGQAIERSSMRRAPVAIQATDPVTTTRDAQGIWFIEGGSLYDVYEAMGYATAQDRLFQMDMNRRQGGGRLSEVLGSDYLQTDVFLRTIGYSDEELAEQFATLSEDAQTAIQAYVDGVNRRIVEIFGNFYAMPYEYWIGSFAYIVMQSQSYNFLPAPWTVNDVLRFGMIFQRNFDPEGMPNSQTGQIGNITLYQTWEAVFPLEFQAMFHDVGWLNDPSAQTMIPAPAAKARYVDVPQTLDVDPFAFPDLRDAGREIQEVVDTYHRQMDELGIRLKMGSYAWAISGDKTASGNAMLYSGPQMGFSAPAIITEGSVRGGGLEVSGMHVPGIPGIAIGRTPHHAWSMQVGHAHTADFFIDSPLAVFLHHWETINIAGADPMQVPVFHTHHGPVINPLPFDPTNPPETVVSWAYANRNHELKITELLIDVARATSIAEVDAAIEMGGVSMHTCYADRDGNIAYWMSGWDPIRQPHSIPLFPQPGDGNHEWTGERRPRVHAVNPAQGYFGGWNNKASYDYMNAPNSAGAYYGPFHRAHVIEEYLSAHDDLTFEEVRDLALNIATTDSIRSGGNTWPFVADFFKAAVAANPTDDRNAAIDMLDAWDGHFVAGGPAAWRFGPDRADAWVLQDAWIKEALRLTFDDEYAAAGLDWHFLPLYSHFDVLIRILQGVDAALPTFYDWFQDKLASGKPTTADGIILAALDNVIASMGLGPYGVPRGEIAFGHQLLASLLDPILGSNFGEMHTIPFSSRSTYAQIVEFGATGPVRIESMFPLGASGMLWFDGTFYPVLDPNFVTMAPAYDPFMPRPFPLFD